MIRHLPYVIGLFGAMLLVAHCAVYEFSPTTSPQPPLAENEELTFGSDLALMECIEMNDLDGGADGFDAEPEGWALRSRAGVISTSRRSSQQIPESLCNLPEPSFSLSGWSDVAGGADVEDICSVAIKCRRDLTMLICASARSTEGFEVIVGCETFGDAENATDVEQCRRKADDLSAASDVFAYACLTVVEGSLVDTSEEGLMRPKRPVDFGKGAEVEIAVPPKAPPQTPAPLATPTPLATPEPQETVSPDPTSEPTAL